MEQVIANLKENDPTLTVRKAKEILEKDGFKISTKGIWGTWQRYGLAGFRREILQNDFTEYIPWTSESAGQYRRAQTLYSLGQIKESAQILNNIPSLPKNELLIKIPDKYLNLKRRIEKLYYLFGTMSISPYLKRVRKLYKKAREEGFNYLALRAGIEEVMALEWSARFNEQKATIDEMQDIIEPSNPATKRGSYLLFEPKYTLFISKGILYSTLSLIKEAKKIAQYCKTLLKRMKKPSPYFMLDLGALYNSIEEYKDAEYWFLRALNDVDEETKGVYLGALAHIYFMKGDYKKAFFIFRDSKFYRWVDDSLPFIYQSFLAVLKGNPFEAMSLVISALKSSRKEFNRCIFGTSLALAQIYSLLGERKKSRNILERLMPFLEKNKLVLEQRILEHILYANDKNPPDENSIPSLRLIHLLKNNKYSQAFSYAQKRWLLSNFYRFVFLIPEVVTMRLENGREIKLPKALLRLPAFNKLRLVYDIHFLGPIRITRNQVYLQVRLRPHDTAFLIYLCQKAMGPKKFVNLEEIYANFWPKSEKASRNFSHLLVRLKRALKIPTHLLEISRASGIPTLINQGIYFTTDYQEFEQALAQAKALERAGEWAFAKKEYLRAFKLFRGEPFKKNFDNWSVEMRFKILTEFETEAVNFAKSCI
ncbi:MAG: hypothetical protein NC828_04445, partial [Candidatus Omnitrophica bacterium]|nr:hypothetical protein [Candidatus Omnitrophota bacterium]